MRVAVGLSGGVDSAVTALLLKERGYDLVGVTMTLGRDGDAEAVRSARNLSERLGIVHVTVDLADDWRREVLGYIRETYLAGATPNPCVRCNEFVKFGLLPRHCFEKLGAEGFATGHYARVAEGRLFRGLDHAKDQSYFLYRVDREILARTILPLGEMTKAEVRELARKAGFESADRGDSQDFCGGDTAAVVGESNREGEVVTCEGKVIGKHRGYWHYTVGMRKGLGIGGGIPYYVVALDAKNNRVIVGHREEAVSHELKLADVVGEIDFALPVKVRSAGEPRLLADGIAGVAPGQSAVFYRGDEVVGGGVIAK